VDILAVIGWPVLDRIHLGPLAISPHGIGIALGYLMGSWFMLREGKKRGLSEENMGTILLWALVGAIFGARFFYVVAHFSEFESFTDMLAVWRGGISLIGGIFGAIAFAYPFMRRFGYRFLQVMDSAAVGLAFGIIIGRIGDLIIGDHLGKPTSFVLGWAYRGGTLPGPWVESTLRPDVWEAQLEGGFIERLSRSGAALFQGGNPAPVMEGAGVHQTALYDFFLVIALFLFLRWLGRVPRREGVLICTFALVYGAGRVVTDFLRVDKHFFGLTGSQWGAILAMTVAALTLLWYARRPLAPASPDGQAGAEGRAPRERTARGASTAGDRPTTEFDPPRDPGPGDRPG
jgi:phosphatidylglycerol---prolipoprotein diacylglyceryl transferase